MDKPLFVIEVTTEVTRKFNPHRRSAKSIIHLDIETAIKSFYKEIEEIRNNQQVGFTYYDGGHLLDARVALLEGSSKHPLFDWTIEYERLSERYSERFLVVQGRVEAKSHFLPYDTYRREFRR